MRTRVAELARFALVGLSSTVVYFAIYAALALAGMPYGLAAVVAFVLSASSGYVLHHRFTFRSGGGSVQSLSWWLALQGTLLVVNLAALTLLVRALSLDRIVAQLLVLPIIPLLGYFVSRHLIFQRR